MIDSDLLIRNLGDIMSDWMDRAMSAEKENASLRAERDALRATVAAKIVEYRELCAVFAERDDLKRRLASADKLRELVEEVKNVMDEAYPVDGEAGGIWFDAHASYPVEFADRADEALDAYDAAKEG